MNASNLLSVLRCGLLVLVALVAIHAGTDDSERGSPTDVYGPWSQGRPGESLDLLLGRAKATDRWDAWYDAGLAAAAAGDKGQAVSYLVTAHLRNPAAAEPRDALRALDVPLPATWVERAGPLALPGRGWTGVALLAIAGLAFGYGVVRWQNGRWKRRGLALTGLVSALIAAPGIAAVLSDADVPWATVIHDTQALDSTGAPIKALPAGTLVIKEQDEPWAGRTVVRLVDNGQVVLVASADAR